MQAMPPTVLSTKVQAAIDTYVPYPVGPTLADHIGISLTEWLEQSPNYRGGGGGGGGTPLICGGDGPTPLICPGGDGPGPLNSHGGDGPVPLFYSTKELAAGVKNPKLIVHPIFISDLPEGKTLVSLTDSGYLTGGRVVFSEPMNHRIYARIRRYDPRFYWMSQITPREDCKLPISYTPWISLNTPTSSTPTPWIRGPYHSDPCCYFVDGLTLLTNSAWKLDDYTYYEEWELNGGTYYWFGFMNAMTRAGVATPGDFVVDVVTIYYWGKEYSFEGEEKPIGKLKRG
jgi:hypothetical protein